MKRFLYYTSVDLTVPSGERTHVVNFIKALTLHSKVTLFCSNIDEQTKNLLKSGNLKIVVPNLSQNVWLRKILITILYMKAAIHCKQEVFYIRSSFYAFLFPLILRLFKPTNSKMVIEVNGSWIEELTIRKYPKCATFTLSLMESRLLKEADCIICVSEMICDNLMKRYGLDRRRFFVVPNGVNTEMFKPIKKEEACAKISLDPKFKYIGFVGWLTEWQDLEPFIDAFSLINRETKEVKFIIVGDGRTRERLEEKVNNIGLRDYAIITGKIPYEDVPYYMPILSVGLIPDKRIKNGKLLSSPIKLWEYLACGIPVIGFKCEDLRFVCEEGVGALIERYDVDEVKTKISDILNWGEEEIGNVKEKARMLAEENSWYKVVDNITEIIDNLWC